jgi:preprotein translocase subunit SecD
MKSDALELLRDANPVPTQPSYQPAELRQRVAAILGSVEPQIETTSLLRRGQIDPPPTGPRWLRPAIAAAVVLVVAGAATTVGVARRTSGANDGPAATVACQVSTADGVSATTARLRSAQTAITVRVEALGGRVTSVETRPGVGTLSLTAKALSHEQAASACAATTTSIRPLIMATVPIDRAGAPTSNPLRGLPFAVPRTDVQYNRLSPTQRAVLSTALSHTDCTRRPIPRADQVVVMCSSAEGPSGPATGSFGAYLLGPALAGDADVVAASATAPSAAGNATWTVQLTPDPVTASGLAAFRQAHHSTRQSRTASNCSRASTPCADFLAITVNGAVSTAPLTVAPGPGSIQISGQFTRVGASALAANLTAARIHLQPLRGH